MNGGTDRVCAYFRVRGRVQGVFYRGSTQEAARRLGITGWVRNREDGDVELLACGPRMQLESLEHWLWQGPPSAQVSGVQRRDEDWQEFGGFEVRR